MSAIRVDENWNAVGSLDEIVRPGLACLKDPSHIAFGGYNTDLFANGIRIKECMQDLHQWLEADDVIVVWAKSSLTLMAELWSKYLTKEAPRMMAVSRSVRTISARNGIRLFDPYPLLTCYGGKPQHPQHRSSNDVEVLRDLFSRLGLTLSDLETKATVRKGPCPSQRERNQQMIEKTQYNYIYLKDSAVFHRRTCSACLNAKSLESILGSVTYNVAAKSRRPCKLCNPVPLLSDKSVFDQLPSKQERQAAEEAKSYYKEIIKMKMLTGEVVPIRRGNVLGWCHYSMHPGAVSKTIMEKHNCLGKNCPYLERYPDTPFWVNYEAEKKAKEKKKEYLRSEKQRKAQEEQALQALAEDWRSCLEEMNSDMHIVRIAMDSPFAYRVFYVSDNSFADGDRYPEFLVMMRQRYPRCSFHLRHIRDVDGHFVTRSEYHRRVRK